MRRFGHYWTATLARGILAAAFGCAAILVPDLAATFLLRPIAVAIAVLFLASYGILDSVIVSVSSFMIPRGTGRLALRIQGLVGIILGLTLFFAVYDRVHVHWYLYLVALQAASLSIADFIVGMHLSRRHGAKSALVTSYVAAAASIAYLLVAARFGDDLSEAAASWMIFLYLLAFGITQTTISARMLYQEVSESHLVHDATRPAARAA